MKGKVSEKLTERMVTKYTPRTFIPWHNLLIEKQTTKIDQVES